MSAYQSVVEFFDRHQLNYRESPEQCCVFAGFASENGRADLCVKTFEDSLISVYSSLPILAPKACRSTIAEVIARANFGMRVGKFELDFNDGQMLFHASSVLPPEGQLDGVTIGRLISTSLAMVERYVPAIMSVIYGNELPADAIAIAEKS